MRINKNTIIFQRMKRQRFLDPLMDISDIEEYIELLRRLQPVSPVFFSRPGEPPRLVNRTIYDDSYITAKLRKDHKIIKGRFAGGRIGYVLEEDLETYARTFRKPLKKLNNIQEEILEYVQNTGGAMKEQIKNDLSFSSPKISAALKRLQDAFLLCEDQTDTDWDTGWFDFSTEWFELDNYEIANEEAVKTVIYNFINSMFFATSEQIKSWSELKITIINKAIGVLIDEGKIVEVSCDGIEEGYICCQDMNCKGGTVPSCVFLLDKSDFLVRAYLKELKDRYKGKEILQYLLIDGEFKGAVEGHWRIGPHNVEDVILNLGEEEACIRKREIIKVVSQYYSKDWSKILKYNSKACEDVY